MTCDRLRYRPVAESRHHLRKEIRMIDRKVTRVIVTCSLAAYAAGQHLQYAHAPVQQVLSLATASSTTAQAGFIINPTTFAKVDPPPPVVPPRDRQEQG
jgi:hypothetical protein